VEYLNHNNVTINVPVLHRKVKALRIILLIALYEMVHVQRKWWGYRSLCYTCILI